MRPEAFDELIKTKYDQGDFAYNPRNWERLAEQLDKKPNKKSRILLWLPMAAMVSFSSIAASLAMIISLPALVHHKESPSLAAGLHKPAPQKGQYIATPAAVNSIPASTTNNNNTSYVPKTIALNHKPEPNPFPNLFLGTHNRQLLPNTINKELHLAETMLKGIPDNDAVPETRKRNASLYAFTDNYYEPEQRKKSSRSSAGLIGGINYGTQATGYTFGVTGKTMISKKLYVEGDLAFVNSSGNGKTETSTNVLTPTAKLAATTKQLSITGNADPSAPATQLINTKPANFTMYYAQFTPTVGYKVHERISVGIGTDMQQLIQNSATGEVMTDKIVPQFDMGVVGKTEYTLNSRVKAGLYYRKGVTNLFVPSDRYMERNYMQVQLKYSIFNK